MGEHWFLLSVAAVVGVSGAVAVVLAALRSREIPLDDTQAIPAVDVPAAFEAGRVQLVGLMPASPLAPPAVERWVQIRDYLIDDAEMRALVEPLYQGPPEN